MGFLNGPKDIGDLEEEKDGRLKTDEGLTDILRLSGLAK